MAIVCSSCGVISCNGNCDPARLERKDKLVEHRPKDPKNN